MRQSVMRNSLLAMLFWHLTAASTAIVFAQEYDESSPYQGWVVEEWASQFVVRGQGPVAPVQPLDTTVPPVQPIDTDALAAAPIAAGLLESITRETATVREANVGTEVVGAAEAKTIGANNVAGLLQDSNTVQNVKSQRRSPISMDPYIRGYRHGQIYANADGAYWFPVRRDLDTMLSSIDPSLIDDVVVLPGPYGLRYGPGFAYINVLTAEAPRYQNGYESHYRSGFDVRTNGGGIYARETAYGGSCDWGFIVNWGLRKSSDYRPGDDAPYSKIPSGYSSQNVLAQFGMDLSPESRIEARYQRIDATDLEFAVQFFDVNYQGTDAFAVSYINEDPCICSEFRVDTWFNFTRMSGDTSSPGKRLPFPVVDRVEAALDDLGNVRPPASSQLLGRNHGDASSAGFRAVKTYGDEESNQLRFGTDFRYITQKLYEWYELSPDVYGPPNPFFTNMPRADMIDPGMFSELAIPWTDYWKTTVGARVDWVHTRANENELRANPSIDGAPDNFHQNDNLYAFYLASELEVSPVWTLKAGGGYAERIPSLVDRYADGVFMGIMQSGFNRVIGSPTLRKERAWQVDLGMTAEYDRCGIRGDIFYSWIDDYNLAYQGEVANDPLGARLLRSTNAELVTLFGFNMIGDLELTERLRAFSSVSYLEGRDRNIRIASQPNLFDQPLYGIVPLEGRAGVVLTDPCGGENWGVELGARMVRSQERLAQLRRGSAEQFTGFAPLELRTPGFTVCYIRAYYNATKNLHLIAGIENLFDKSYVQHLDLRLPNQTNVPVGDPRSYYTQVFSPGFSPYMGVEWTY